MQKAQDGRIVWFPQWAEVLEQESLPTQRKETYKSAIIKYLAFCRDQEKRASVPCAREYADMFKLQNPSKKAELADIKEALNCFFKTVRRFHTAALQGAPPLARGDLGTTE